MGVPDISDLPLVYRIEPTRLTSINPNPLLILLHGRGSDEHDLLGIVPAAVPDFLVVSVRAPYRFPYGGYTWFDLENMDTPNLNQLEESVDLLSRFVVEIQQLHRVDPSNIYFFGFSMGAMIALETALSKPAAINGVVAHSGGILRAELLPQRKAQLRSLSIFIAHGINDPVIPVSMARQTNELLLHANARIQYREYPIQHTISEESLRDASLWLREQLVSSRMDG